MLLGVGCWNALLLGGRILARGIAFNCKQGWKRLEVFLIPQS